jgi:hypothetical protein
MGRYGTTALRRAALLLLATSTAVAGASPAAAQADPHAPTTADLPLMVLPRQALGAGDGFALEADSGRLPNGAAAPGLEMSDEELAQLGRIDGYLLGFRRGLVRLDTEVELTSGPAAADALMRRKLAIQAKAGVSSSGETLGAVRTLPVSDVGQAASAVSFAVRALGRFGYRGTFVIFRSGPFVGSVQVSRPRDVVAKTEATSLARALSERIAGVLAGSVAGSSTPVKPTPPRQPAGQPRLARMALARADLPGRPRIARQRYVAPFPNLGAFRRDFAPGPAVRLGRARDVTVETTLGVAESAAAARFAFASRRLFDAKLAQRYREALGADGIHGVPVRLAASAVRVGADEAVAHRASFRFPGGRPFANVILTLRVGRVVASLDAADLEGRISVADIRPLARRQVARIRAELRRHVSAPVPKATRSTLELSQLGRTARASGPFLYEGAANGSYTIEGTSRAQQTLSVRMLRDGIQQGPIKRVRLVSGARYGGGDRRYFSIRYIQRPCLLGSRATWVVQVRLSAVTSRGVITTAWNRGPGVRLAC